MSIFGKMGSGPLWHPTINTVQEACRKYWWASIFYFQNYHNPDELVRTEHSHFFIYFLWFDAWSLKLQKQVQLRQHTIFMFFHKGLLSFLRGESSNSVRATSSISMIMKLQFICNNYLGWFNISLYFLLAGSENNPNLWNISKILFHFLISVKSTISTGAIMKHRLVIATVK